MFKRKFFKNKIHAANLSEHEVRALITTLATEIETYLGDSSNFADTGCKIFNDEELSSSYYDPAVSRSIGYHGDIAEIQKQIDFNLAVYDSVYNRIFKDPAADEYFKDFIQICREETDGDEEQLYYLLDGSRNIDTPWLQLRCYLDAKDYAEEGDSVKFSIQLVVNTYSRQKDFVFEYKDFEYALTKDNVMEVAERIKEDIFHYLKEIFA